MKVAVIMGSDSDLGRLQGALEQLRALEIPFEARVLSAHRTPQALIEFVTGNDSAGSDYLGRMLDTMNATPPGPSLEYMIPAILLPRTWSWPRSGVVISELLSKLEK